jgi:GNAT superfamily N-acetyltransferase
VAITYEQAADLDPSELHELFARAWDGEAKATYPDVLARSFTWISAHDAHKLVGFVNVAWDGGVHFFLLDTTVHPEYQRRGIGTGLVGTALAACRGHGQWVHVDADAALMDRLYLPVGFRPTSAGVASVLA